jgi:hypothetical protein
VNIASPPPQIHAARARTRFSSRGRRGRIGEEQDDFGKVQHMRRTIVHVCSGLLAALLALFPASGEAMFPVAMLGKQLLQNIFFGQVKNEMIGSLAGMGCKGAHLAGLIAIADAGKGGGGGMSGGLAGGMPGGAPGGGLPGGMQMPEPGTGAGNGAGLGPGRSLRAARANGIPEVTPEQAAAMMRNGTPDLAAIMAQMPGMPQMSPEQAAQMQQAMAGMQQAMNHPLSRDETLAVFDEMSSLGVLTEGMHREARDCIALASPASLNAAGTAGAMMKNTVLPALRQLRQDLDALTPEEQSALADNIVEGLNEASPGDRKAFLDGFGAGFYPAPVVEMVRSRLGKP